MPTEIENGREAISAIGAIRLALEGAADPDTAGAIIEAILQDVAPTPPSDTYSLRMLVDAMRAAEAEIVVN